MTTRTLKQEYIRIDNRLTYIIGNRNLYNFAALFVACMSWWFADNLHSSELYMVFIILGVISGHWIESQIQQNIDATYVKDALSGE